MSSKQKEEEKEKFEFIVDYLYNYFKEKKFTVRTAMDDANIIKLAYDGMRKFSIDYWYTDIRIQTSIITRSNQIVLKMENGQIKLNNQLIFNLDHDIILENKQFKFNNKNNFDKSLNDFIDQIKVKINPLLIPVPSPCHSRDTNKIMSSHPVGLSRSPKSLSSPPRHMLPPPPRDYMNESMPPGFRAQFLPRPGNSYEQLPSHYAQAVGGDWNKTEDVEDMGDEKLIRNQDFNRTYRPGESLTKSNHNSNTLSFEQQQPSGSTTPTNNSQRIIPQSIPATSSHSSKLITNNNSSLSLLPPPASSSDLHMRFSPMIPGSFGMRPRRHHPYYNPRMHPPSHQLNLNAGQSPSLPQTINNIFVPTTMSIEPSNIQNLGPSAPPGESQTDAIHSSASSGDVRNSQQQQSLLNDPEFLSLLNDIRIPPSNRNVDDGQPPPY